MPPKRAISINSNLEDQGGGFALVGGPAVSAQQQRDWLEGSASWIAFPKVWKGHKVLGAGANGICGLWDYTGTSQQQPRHLVVKQSPNNELDIESKLLRECTAQGAEHVVKLYRQNHRADGSGTHENWDPSPYVGKLYERERQVYRIFIEYCENGDLEGQLFNTIHNLFPQSVPEEYIWRIFHCLAKGCAMLEKGRENPTLPSGPRKPIVHFDIKPANS